MVNQGMRIPETTQMFAEAREASSAVARQLAANVGVTKELANRLSAFKPSLIFTCARGSSDHAATYAKYLFETRLRIPTISQAPSISSIYGGALLHMKNAPFILISQSGRSPDLLASAKAAKTAGALVIAFVNDMASPLAEMAEVVVPLCAGPETSVAATKSYIAALAAIASLVAHWSADSEMQAAVERLPQTLATAWEADWSAGVERFETAQSLFVLGRGLSLGVAQEAALKLKEACGIHGEAFSIAEVAHGPMALVKPDFPILVLPPLDKAAAGLDKIITQFAERGAKIAVAGGNYIGGNYADALRLPLEDRLHPVTAPIAMVQSFYRMVNALSVTRGYDPDHPPMLNKVTRTV
jgi:glutamine---fructose-6-phosphate transaminase (isomerizing)